MKQVTIGVTINIGNYESLRVDVVDECPDWAIEAIDDALQNIGRTDPDMCAKIDAFRKRAFADVPVLVRRSRGATAIRKLEEAIAAKPETATETATEQIASDPILEDVPAQTPAKKGTTERIIDPATLPRVCDKCGCELTGSEAVASALYANGAVRCVACRYPGLDTESMFQKPKSNSDPTPATETAAIPEPEQEQPAKNPTPVNYACEECHVEIDKTQADVSQLFMNRNLCKECMYKQPKERTA